MAFRRASTAASLPGVGWVPHQRDPGATGQHLDGIAEVHALGFLDEAEDVSALAATEAVVQTTGAVDGH
jgi:hypothetical protein